MAATSFFGGAFFDGEFFNTAAPSSGGKGDNAAKRATLRAFKPTGLLSRKAKRVPEGRKDVETRVEQAREIETEVAGSLAREFLDEPALQAPVLEMSLAAIEAEIGALLQKKLRTEDDEMMLLVLMAAVA